jgi:hypothetical protein
VSQIPTFTPTVAGTARKPTYGNAAAGDTIAPGTVLHVKNASGASVTVTIAVPGNLPTGDAYPDKAYTIPTADEQWIPILALYADPTDGQAHLTWGATASVTRAAIALGR